MIFGIIQWSIGENVQPKFPEPKVRSLLKQQSKPQTYSLNYDRKKKENIWKAGTELFNQTEG